MRNGAAWCGVETVPFQVPTADARAFAAAPAVKASVQLILLRRQSSPDKQSIRGERDLRKSRVHELGTAKAAQLRQGRSPRENPF